jgi:hypothetical protein
MVRYYIEILRLMINKLLTQKFDTRLIPIQQQQISTIKKGNFMAIIAISNHILYYITALKFTIKT